jgi:hypothetical protein
MNLTASILKRREPNDPDYADYWLVLEHVSGVSWEVPLTRAELKEIRPWLPRGLRDFE